MSYVIGQMLRHSVLFESAAGAAVDPGTVRFRVRRPDGTLATLEYGTDAAVVKDSAGNYHCDLSLDEAGAWTLRWEGLGANQAAAESQVLVAPSAFG